MPGDVEAARDCPGGAARRRVRVNWGQGNNLAAAQGKNHVFPLQELGAKAETDVLQK